MRKGSITIFSLLSMMLVMSALLALLEAARFHEMNRLSQLQTQIALESVFAEYSTYLWNEYRVLACRQSELLPDVETYGNSKILGWKDGTNFYQFRVESVKAQGYTRLTDGKGKAFVQAVAGYMEENILYEAAQLIYSQYESIESILGESDFDFLDIKKALEKLEEAETSTESTASYNLSNTTKEKTSSGENPLTIIQGLKETGILSLVIEDVSVLSDSQVDTTNLVSNRELLEGLHPNVEEVDWYHKVLLQQYLITYLSNYVNEKEHALCYELEYLVGGKPTDVENLKIVVSKLLGLRAASNFLYLLNSSEKVEQARLLAIAIAGASLNPSLIAIVKNAVLIAWAFSESILDIRTLLTGGRIPLIKSNTSWTLAVDNIASIGEGYAKAKDCVYGLDYGGYVGILLLLQEESTLANRSMDMQEATIRKRYGTEDFCLDDWIVDAKVEVTYKYNPVFFGVDSVYPRWEYEFIVQREFGY